MLHTGGTLGMSTKVKSRDDLDGAAVFRRAAITQRPSSPVLLLNLVTVVPELRTFANLEVKVLMNKDSCQTSPRADRDGEGARRATKQFRRVHVVHGTDIMAHRGALSPTAARTNTRPGRNCCWTCRGRTRTELIDIGDVRRSSRTCSSRRWRCVSGGNCSARTERGRRARRYTARSVRRDCRWRSSASGWSGSETRFCSLGRGFG